MSPDKLDAAVVADRASWIRNMLAGIQELPQSSLEAFTRDRHVTAAAESYLRRAIESLVDLGRHILAKRFAIAVSEYKAVPAALEEVGVIRAAHVSTFTRICGYRNRMVHFYHRISDEELYTICREHTEDLSELLKEMLGWIDAQSGDTRHPG